MSNNCRCNLKLYSISYYGSNMIENVRRFSMYTERCENCKNINDPFKILMYLFGYRPQMNAAWFRAEFYNASNLLYNQLSNK